MAARTHTSDWRGMVAAAPLLGVVFIVWGFLQGEHDIARSGAVYAVLAAVSTLGALVAALTSWQLGRIAKTSVAHAQAGMVALSGRAQPLPGHEPLMSPYGVPCLWYHHSERVIHRYEVEDSLRPFLLVDDSGSCIVLPAGADITGRDSQAGMPRKERVADITGRTDNMPADSEDVLGVGETIHVVGWFTPASPQALQLQSDADRLAQKAFVPRVVVRSQNAGDFKRLLAEGPPPMPAPPSPAAPLALPVIGATGTGGKPFIISIRASSGQGGFYTFLAAVDGLLACATALAAWWLASHPG